MATPKMQSQTLALSANRGATSLRSSQPVLDETGTAIDFTVGTWVFRLLQRPTNPNLSAPANVLTSGVTISGNALGVVSIELDKGFCNVVDSLSNSYFIQCSNDALSTTAEPIQGALQISPAQTIG